MKKSVYLLCLISSVLIMSCASNKTGFSTIDSNNELNTIEMVNKTCNPYSDKYLEFIIITNEIQISKYEDKNIFKVILDHGNIDIQLTDKYENLGATNEETEFVVRSHIHIGLCCLCRGDGLVFASSVRILDDDQIAYLPCGSIRRQSYM